MTSEALRSLLKNDPKPKLENYDDLCDLIDKVDIEIENDPENLKKAFTITQFVLKNVSRKNRENQIEIQEFEKEIRRSTIKIQSYEDDLERLQKELKIYQQDSFNTGDPRQLQSEIARLETRNEELRSEVKEYEMKHFQEKSEKEKFQAEIDKMDRELKRFKRDNERYQEEIKEYTKQIREEKISRGGDDQGIYREKINYLNKRIAELEEESTKLLEENFNLNKLLEENRKYLQESTYEMEKTRDEILKLRRFQQQADSQTDQLKKENDILRSQIELLNSQLLTHKDQDVAIMNAVEARIKEFRLKLQDKDEEIRRLMEMVFQLEEKLKKTTIDSDKVDLLNLRKALADRDNQIQLLKTKIEENAHEMDKSTAVINNLNKTLYENSKMFSKSSQYNANKQAEQRILFLEKMLRDSESRLKECEQQATEKEKEYLEVLNRMREYESGDYQLQQAVNEIKGLKNQIKIRDRDIENLVQNINKLDYTLNDILEENDELRAKLGMDPREKLNLDDMNNLKAVRAQESRAVMHVLKREIETLEEERAKLKRTIRKMAQQLGSKVNIPEIMSEDFLDDLLNESKPNKKDSGGTESASKSATSATTTTTNQVDPKTARENELMKKRYEYIAQLCLQLENEKSLLEKGLIEIHKEMETLNSNKTNKNPKQNFKNKETLIKCPSLDKFLAEIELNRASQAKMKTYAFLNHILADGNPNNVSIALKSEIDFLQGRNEELRSQLIQMRNDLNKSQMAHQKCQEEIDRLNGDVRLMNSYSSAKEIFQPLKLPSGMAPSSQDIISGLNEYLIDTLQELEEYKKICTLSEKDLETLKRKYSVARHQLSLLYNDHLEETKNWQKEKETLLATIRKQTEKIDIDSVKLQEYDRLLDTLEKDDVEMRRRIAECSRQTTALRCNEKQLQRKCSALEETDIHIIKENKKMRIEIIEMEIAVQQRFGYLERYKDMANFRIMSLQKQLEETVPMSKLDTVNKEYNDLVQKYRQLLDKQDRNDSLSVSLHQTEQLNRKYENEIEFLKKEIEKEKDRANILEESLERLKKLPIPSAYSIYPEKEFSSGHYGQNLADAGAASASAADSNNIVSLAKRLTAIEMRELNERQKADHAQKMYDEQRNMLRQLENRNLELENNIAQLNKNYLSLLKTEQDLRDELSRTVPKIVNDAEKLRILELEKQENLLKLEISRLRELTEITLYQTASLEFINNMSKLQMESFNLIDLQSFTQESSDLGKLHRQIIILQISEATAVRKLQQSQNRCKKLEAQLIRAEQKHDKETIDFYTNRKEQISKITYLRATVQDLRHKYTGSIPLKQQEKFHQAKEQISELKKEFTDKLIKINDEQHELEDQIAEYKARCSDIEMLKNAAIVGADGSVKFNEKFLDSYKKSENLRMLNLKLERANRKCKDEKKFLEEMNRKLEIAIIGLEEENLRMETDYDQKLLIWEHREADLERTIESLRKQHQMIENLAISFEEISGNMPDPTLPIANQLDQAMNIIRSHIKLLAEAKIQSDLSKKRTDEYETKIRKLEGELNIRDKVITELRLRLPATAERDALIKSTMNGTNNMDPNNTPVKAAQTTIESLQSRLKQKDLTLVKYQDMLKLARDEINQLNKQHEIEINNLIEKLNLTRDTNLKKLRQELKYSSSPENQLALNRNQLNRLQELEEVTIEQDNTISALNQKIRKLNTEIDTWKARHEMANQKAAQDLEETQKEKLEIVNRLNAQIEEYREKISKQEKEINSIIADLENQKSLNSKSPSAEVKAMVDKLKQQLAQKEEQQKALSQALVNLKGEMVNIAKANLTSMGEDQAQEKKMQNIIEKTSAEYQDKLFAVSDELVKCKKELKQKTKANEELTLELEHAKSQLKTKEQKIKKLQEENAKLIEDAKIFSTNKISQNFNLDSNKSANELDNLRRQVKTLEEKLKKQKQAERPYEQSTMPRSKSPKSTENAETKFIIRTIPTMNEKIQSDNIHTLKIEMEQWKTRYNYVLSENTILNRQKHDLEVEIERLRRDVDINGVEVLKENKMLREELDKIKNVKGRSFSPSTSTKQQDVRLENKNQLINEVQKLKKENEKLKEKANKVEELQKYVDLLKAENSKMFNEDAQSTSSNSTTSNLRRIGESGKSNKELEKTISLMKKIILKLQQENESLKKSS